MITEAHIINTSVDIIVTGAILLFIVLFFYYVNKIVNMIYSIKKYKIMIDNNINYKETIDVLDNIINDGIRDFCISKGLFDTFISDKLESEMRVYVNKFLSSRISESFKNKLSLVYNEQYLPDIIAKRIYNEITLFVANNNTTYKK